MILNNFEEEKTLRDTVFSDIIFICHIGKGDLTVRNISLTVIS